MTRKSSEDRPRERSRGTQNRMRIDPGNLSGHPMPPKSVPEASRERPGSVPGASRGVPGTPRDAPGTLPRRLRNALGQHGVSREGSGIDFHSIFGASGPFPGSIFTRFSRRFSRHFCKRAGQRMACLSTVRYTVRRTLRSKSSRQAKQTCTRCAAKARRHNNKNVRVFLQPAGLTE